METLPDGDLKTGTVLVESYLEKIKDANPGLRLAFEQPKTKADLLQLLDKIHDETSSDGLYPLLHLECHGCPDGLSAVRISRKVTARFA